MARFLPSSATFPLDVVAPDVATRLSVVVMDRPVEPGETFEIKGTLTRLDTVRGLPGATIPVSYNGVNVGTRVTDSNGTYSIYTSIPSPGSYTLRATFAGMTIAGVTFKPSQASWGLPITGISIPNLAVGAIAPIIVGAIIAYLRG